LKTGRIGCTETSVTTNQRCVTSQKREGLIETAAEAHMGQRIYELNTECLFLRMNDIEKKRNQKQGTKRDIALFNNDVDC
jgi:hypothetical protein